MGWAAANVAAAREALEAILHEFRNGTHRALAQPRCLMNDSSRYAFHALGCRSGSAAHTLNR